MASVLLICVLWALPTGTAQSAEPEIRTSDTPETVPTTSGEDEILLKDGNLLRGEIIEENEALVVFETRSLGRLEILREQIEAIARAGDTGGVVTDPDGNSIMFCPTPATLPAGDFYFRSFELVVLNLGFSVTEAFDFSIGTLFPVSADATMISGGAKLRLLDRERSPFGLALTGAYTVLEDTRFGMVGVVAGIGDEHRSLNLVVNRTFDEDDEQGTAFMVGGDLQVGRGSKIFAEFLDSTVLLDEDDDLAGFINIGVRWFGRNHSFSLSGFRPLVEDAGSFIAFPMVMYSHHW